jgi:transcriptional/translational regulatory protein YebC/TACO1
MFERKGIFTFASSAIQDLDEFELEFIDHGLEDLVQDEGKVFMYTSFQDYGKMQKALEEKGIEATSVELQFIPTTTKELTEEQAKEVQELLEKLEDDDDVQSVFHTMG